MQNLLKLVYVYYNMRLKVRNMTNKSSHKDYYNLIDLSHIFEENSTIDPQIHEVEGSLLDGQDIDSLEESEDTRGTKECFRRYDDDDDPHKETNYILYT